MIHSQMVISGVHPGVIGVVDFPLIKSCDLSWIHHRESRAGLRFITVSGLSCDDMVISWSGFPLTIFVHLRFSPGIPWEKPGP